MIIGDEDALVFLDAKERYGKLLRIRVGGLVILARPLTIRETEVIAAMGDHVLDAWLQHWILEKCVLLVNHPLGPSYLTSAALPGVAAVTASAISDHSMAASLEEVDSRLEKARKETETLSKQIEGILLQGIPSLTLHQIRELHQAQQIDLVALAEQLTGKRIEILPQQKKSNAARALEARNNALRILQKEAADPIDFEKDNKELGL